MLLLLFCNIAQTLTLKPLSKPAKKKLDKKEYIMKENDTYENLQIHLKEKTKSKIPRNQKYVTHPLAEPCR